MVNEVILLGNLGDDVKLHFFEGGGCIGRFPLATSRSWKDKTSGEKQTETSWHNIVVRNKQAEHCEKYLKKGSKVYVHGSIAYRKWQAEDGNERYTTEINARTVQFLDPRGEGSFADQPRTERSGSNQGHAGDQFLAGNVQKPDALEPEEEHDDLPF